jgi:isopentenyldiphosphate isomerase
MEHLDIINENDEITGSAPRNEIYQKGLLHRIVHILIFNDKGEMALQLRSENVGFCPLHWSTSVGGHVESGETEEKAAFREYEEELGESSNIKLLYKDLYEKDGLRKMLVTFKAVNNGPFDYDRSDVKDLQFFSLAGIQNMVDNNEKLHPELLFLLAKHFGIKKK